MLESQMDLPIHLQMQHRWEEYQYILAMGGQGTSALGLGTMVTGTPTLTLKTSRLMDSDDTLTSPSTHPTVKDKPLEDVLVED